MKLHYKKFKFWNNNIGLLICLTWGVWVCGQTFTDNASNYGGSWTNNLNHGTGFGNWILTSGSNSGSFIGNPANNGMGTTGIGTTAFGMFSTGTGYFSAYRSINNGIQIGDIFSFYWAINWDANTGAKGFDLRSGSTTIFNVNNGGSSTITINNVDANTNYGTAPMLVTVTRTSESQYLFIMTSRSGGASYSTTIISSLTIDGFNIYIGNQNDGNGNRNMYVNGFSITKPITVANGNWNSTSTWLNNTIPPTGASITIDHNVTANTDISLRSLVINSGKTLTASDATPRTITISNGGSITTNNGTFNAGNGTVAFTGTGTVSGTVGFNNVNIAGGVNFGTGSTINGILTINSGGFVNTNAPTYAAGSTLRYNSGDSYGRGSEWSATSDRGYPHHVQISGNTTLNVHNNQNTQRQIAGNLTIDSGSTFTTSSMNVSDQPIGVIILGNIINNGTFTLSTSADRVRCVNFTNNTGATATLSTTPGGDLELTGNLIDNATFNANTRAVFFTGSGTQEISGSGTFSIDYMVLNKPSGTVRLLNNLLCEGPNGGNLITLTNTTDILDLNGFTATFGKENVSSVLAGNGFIRGGGNSSIILLGTSPSGQTLSMGTLRFDQTTPGTTNVLNNLTINRASTGSVTLGNSLVVTNALTLTDGTFNIGTNQLTLNGSISSNSGVINSASGLVTFSGSTAQTIPASTFSSGSISNLTLSNSAGLTSNQALTVGSLNLSNGTLNMQTNALSGSSLTTSGSGKLQTQNTSATPIPSGRTWSFEVEMNANSDQTVPQGNYANLRLNTGGTKTISDNTAIAGHLIVENATATVGNNIRFNGSSAQNIAGLAYNNIAFSNAGTKTFTSNASVSPTSAITFSDTPGTVDFDGVSNNLEFVLQSTAVGTARLGNATGWTLNGQVRAERFVPAKRAWRLLTAPLKGNTNDKISNNWQGTTNEGLLLFSPATFQSQTMTGYAPGGSSPNIWRYNNAWQSIPNLTEEPLFSSERNNAFLVFATGPHGSSYITSGQTETTLKPKGQLFTGDPQGNVTITGLTTGQYHLIGNPFASPINTDALRVSNNSFTFWLLDPTLGSFGGYYTFNGTNWTPIAPNQDAGQPENLNIQSGQGFFVRSAIASTFTFNESHKVAGNSNTWFEKQSVQNISENKIRVLLDRQTNTQWQLVDGILSVSGSTYANEVDAQDALKVSNFNENIQFRNGTTNLAIEYLNLPTMATEQPIRLTGTTATSYRLRVRTEGFASLDVQPVLQDTQSGTNHLIPTDGSTLEIPFTGVVSNANTPDTRFKIVYQQVLGVEQPISSSLQVYPNPVTEGYFNVSVPNVNEAATYQVSNYLGQVVQQGVIEYGKNTIFITSQAAGVYLIKLTQNGAVYTAKVVKK
jgi:hypothetical protein